MADNNALEHQQEYKEKPLPQAVFGAARQFGTKAAAMAGDQIGRVADMTETQVRAYPLAAVGIALGSGIALGVLGAVLFTPRPPSLMDRIADMKLGAMMRRRMKRYF
jgi:hypothetical protein